MHILTQTRLMPKFKQGTKTPDRLPPGMAFTAGSLDELNGHDFRKGPSLAVLPRVLDGDYDGLSAFIAREKNIASGKKENLTLRAVTALPRQGMTPDIRRAFEQVVADMSDMESGGRCIDLQLIPAVTVPEKVSPEFAKIVGDEVFLRANDIFMHADASPYLAEAARGRTLCSYNGHSTQFTALEMVEHVLQVPGLGKRYSALYDMIARKIDISSMEFVDETAIGNLFLPKEGARFVSASPGSITRHALAVEQDLPFVKDEDYDGVRPQPHRAALDDLQAAMRPKRHEKTHRLMLRMD